MKLIDLDDAVVNALELFKGQKLPRLSIKFRRPLVVGSGNAAITGKVLFHDRDAVFADETTYKDKLKAVQDIDGAVLISASGGKHAPGIAKYLKKRGLTTVLLTCNPDAPASGFVNKTLLFPRNTEPYSYNVSTYLGMMLAKTGESPAKILDSLKKVRVPDMKRYDAFFMIIPPGCDALREMLLKKFSEMFGPRINGRVAAPEQVKHGVTIVNSDKELFISLGYDNRIWGEHRWNVSMKSPDFAAVMAMGYYVIGRIQKQKPDWFKRSIKAYCEKMSRVFGQKIEPVVKA